MNFHTRYANRKVSIEMIWGGSDSNHSAVSKNNSWWNSKISYVPTLSYSHSCQEYLHLKRIHMSCISSSMVLSSIHPVSSSFTFPESSTSRQDISASFHITETRISPPSFVPPYRLPIVPEPHKCFLPSHNPFLTHPFLTPVSLDHLQKCVSTCPSSPWSRSSPHMPHSLRYKTQHKSRHWAHSTYCGYPYSCWSSYDCSWIEQLNSNCSCSEYCRGPIEAIHDGIWVVIEEKPQGRGEAGGLGRSKWKGTKNVVLDAIDARRSKGSIWRRTGWRGSSKGVWWDEGRGNWFNITTIRFAIVA